VNKILKKHKCLGWSFLGFWQLCLKQLSLLLCLELIIFCDHELSHKISLSLFQLPWKWNPKAKQVVGNLIIDFNVTANKPQVEEAKQVLSAGLDYVTEKNWIMLFKLPKFSKYI